MNANSPDKTTKKRTLSGILTAAALLCALLAGCTTPAGQPPAEEPKENAEQTVPAQTPDALPEADQPKEPAPSEQTPAAPEAPPVQLTPSVVIPSQVDPSTGESLGLEFPCTVPQYDLVIEKIAPYTGPFVEDGSNRDCSDVAMLLVRNDGSYPVEYTQLSVDYGSETLLFDLSALPAGARAVVQEKTGKTIPDALPTACEALVLRRAELEMSEDVSVTDNGDNTLTITNLTDSTIPTVRVFYKYYDENSDVFVGGIAFTVRITRLGASSGTTIQPSHYTSNSSRVVMVSTYDTAA